MPEEKFLQICGLPYSSYTQATHCLAYGFKLLFKNKVLLTQYITYTCFCNKCLPSQYTYLNVYYSIRCKLLF